MECDRMSSLDISFKYIPYKIACFVSTLSAGMTRCRLFLKVGRDPNRFSVLIPVNRDGNLKVASQFNAIPGLLTVMRIMHIACTHLLGIHTAVNCVSNYIIQL